MGHHSANCVLVMATAVVLILLVICLSGPRGGYLRSGAALGGRKILGRREGLTRGVAAVGDGSPMYCSHVAPTKNTCVQCDTDHPCTSPQVCSPSNACVDCNGDADCPAGQYCVNSACTPCDSTHACKDGTSQCLIGPPNSCVQCLDDNGCPNGSVCATTGGSANTCVQCEDSRGCPSGSVCSPGNQCVACNVNTDCPAGMYCYNNACVQCVTADPTTYACATGVCSTDSGSENTCVQCNVDTDCSSPPAAFRSSRRAKFTPAPSGALPPGWAPTPHTPFENVSPITSNCLYGPYDEESVLCSYNYWHA